MSVLDQGIAQPRGDRLSPRMSALVIGLFSAFCWGTIASAIITLDSII